MRKVGELSKTGEDAAGRSAGAGAAGCPLSVRLSARFTLMIGLSMKKGGEKPSVDHTPLLWRMGRNRTTPSAPPQDHGLSPWGLQTEKLPASAHTKHLPQRERGPRLGGTGVSPALAP